jgi:hypothetical protein
MISLIRPRLVIDSLNKPGITSLLNNILPYLPLRQEGREKNEFHRQKKLLKRTNFNREVYHPTKRLVEVNSEKGGVK